ncbi:hypothetical protein [Mangrovibacterium lignilyticum]|uniref:hypothetical protein n=1 Tax=Mangrovibacterium lignilyticum TaxID=2668052 RepID=UPI0013D23B06|nr:hypothetical protein [Mangrovibacterium lignilyticum]
MTNDELINIAIQELKKSDKPYLMFKDFSFMNGLDWDDNNFQKIRYLILKSSPFEKHTDHAVKLSSLGLTIANDYKNWFDYKKSLKPRFDYAKWIAVVIALLSLTWNMYQGISNNNLMDDNRILHDKIEALEKDNADLLNQIKMTTNKK